MTFSEQLKAAGQPILKKIMVHPFVQGIGAGQLPKAALTFYVGQDFNYLNAFIKVYAAAIQKCTNRNEMQLFATQIDFILNSEIHPHHNFCQVAGVPYASVQHDQQTPMTYLYNEHMYNAARTGDLIDIVAAMLPCPWTYNEIGNALVAAGAASEQNVFKPWIDFYSAPTTDQTTLTNRLFALLDAKATQYGPQRLAQVQQRFLKSCELEWHFWDQAYQQKSWQFVD